MHHVRQKFGEDHHFGRSLSLIADIFPEEVSIVRRGGRWHSRLRLRSGLIVSVLVARSIRAWKETFCWQVDPVSREGKYTTLLARLDRENQHFLDYHVLPSTDRATRFHIRRADAWLERGLRLNDLSEFCTLVARVRGRKPRLRSRTDKPSHNSEHDSGC